MDASSRRRTCRQSRPGRSLASPAPEPPSMHRAVSTVGFPVPSLDRRPRIGELLHRVTLCLRWRMPKAPVRVVRTRACSGVDQPASARRGSCSAAAVPPAHAHRRALRPMPPCVPSECSPYDPTRSDPPPHPIGRRASATRTASPSPVSTTRCGPIARWAIGHPHPKRRCQLRFYELRKWPNYLARSLAAAY